MWFWSRDCLFHYGSFWWNYGSFSGERTSLDSVYLRVQVSSFMGEEQILFWRERTRGTFLEWVMSTEYSTTEKVEVDVLRSKLNSIEKTSCKNF